MMAMAQAGFVFLSMAKAGSTAVQQHFGGHSQLIARRPPALKHVDARTFERLWVPVLEQAGFPRSSYELVCLVREPVARAESWWRYRSRPELEGQPEWTGHLSFEQFAEQVVSRQVKYRSASRFVTAVSGEVLVERIYRYEHIDAAAAWMAEQLKIAAPALEPVNVSPRPASAISESARAMLEEFFAADLALPQLRSEARATGVRRPRGPSPATGETCTSRGSRRRR